MALVMMIVAVMPSTFSWYNHGGDNPPQGNRATLSVLKLPVSGSRGFSAATYRVDEYGENLNNNTVTNVTFDSASTNIQYYKTVFSNKNNPSGDVYADLELRNLVNNVNIRVGTTSPTINEKGFNITRVPTTYDKIRVYFQPTAAYESFWYNDDYSSNKYDMKIRYYVGSEANNGKMKALGNPNNSYKDAADGKSTTAAKIFYYDIPSDTTSFFFYNHWYDDNDANKDWNRTRDITEIVPCRLYKLNGKEIQSSYKIHVYEEDQTVFAALSNYYSHAYVSKGGDVDLGLHNTNDTGAESFVADYHGKSISYSSSNTNIFTVDKAGNVHASETNSGDATLTTTIQGVFNNSGSNTDTITVTTTVHVVNTIDQMPVFKNVLVPKNEEVELYWYVINKTNETNIAEKIFYTI